MRIAVVGVGGVGGYVGGRLAAAGQDVVFVARGRSLAALRTRGLRVDSPKGDLVLDRVEATDHPGEVGPVDAVVVAVKAWQVPETAQQIRPLVGPDTVVLPLQNGVEAPGQLAEALGYQHVLGGLCRIISFLVGPGHVRHAGAEPTVVLGELDNRRTPRAQALRAALDGAGVQAEIADDILAALWEKFLLIASWGGLGAVTRVPVGPLRSTPETRALLEEAMAEIAALALAHGVTVAPGAAARALAFMDNLPGDATASLQRDIADGRPSELDAHSGAVVRLAAATGTPTPVHRFCYATLLPAERQARR